MVGLRGIVLDRLCVIGVPEAEIFGPIFHIIFMYEPVTALSDTSPITAATCIIQLSGPLDFVSPPSYSRVLWR